jgi:thiol:disulfide interchange protein
MLTVPAAAVLSLIIVGLILWLINGYIPIPAGKLKTVLNVVLGLIVVGICLWLINTYIPMAGVIKVILNIVVVVATCVGVLQAFGLWDSVLNTWRKIKNHRWTHPEDKHPVSEQKSVTEQKPPSEQKQVTEKAPPSQRPVTVNVTTERSGNGAPAEQNSGEKEAEKKDPQKDPAVTVIV